MSYTKSKHTKKVNKLNSYLKDNYIIVNKKIDYIINNKNSIVYINPNNFKVICEIVDNLDASLFNKIYYRLDGLITPLLFRLFVFDGSIIRESFDMTSLAPEVFNYCYLNNKTIISIGGTYSEANKFRKKVNRNYGNIISDAFSGYLSDEELKKIVNNSSADLYLIGLGAKKQEKFIFEMINSGVSKCFMSCGAFITQYSTTNSKNYYPKYINKFHLRWLYRIINEKKTRKRFFKNYTLFPLKLIKKIYFE